MRWHRYFRSLKIFALITMFLAIIAPEWPEFGDQVYQLSTIVGGHQFDFLVWETNAFIAKGETVLTRSHDFLGEAQRRELVLGYLGDVQAARQLEFEVNQIYSDATISDPEAVSADIQTELTRLRAAIQDEQNIAEAIVQEQVADILANEGFALAGQAWPPVLMHVSQLPLIMIVSPRTHVEQIYGIPLVPDLTTQERERLETAVSDQLDFSALIVPLGGLGSYPAMITETGSVNRLTEVVAHEWVHHWLTLHPLGFSYAFDPSVRIINETVAAIVDREFEDKVVERYYPEHQRQPAPAVVPAELNPDEPPVFSFQFEMGITRQGADELLEEGKIEEAEAYMEARRQIFVENGYAVRKINQAYFAFYGAYAARPNGAQGGNPIGPMLRDIRAGSPSIRSFMDAVAPITSFEELQELHTVISVQ